MEFIIGLVFGILLTIISVWFTLDPAQTLTVLNETCNANKGVETFRVNSSEFQVTCKDTARFVIKR